MDHYTKVRTASEVRYYSSYKNPRIVSPINFRITYFLNIFIRNALALSDE